jgi:hypothetical protein
MLESGGVIGRIRRTDSRSGVAKPSNQDRAVRSISFCNLKRRDLQRSGKLDAAFNFNARARLKYRRV